MRRTPAELVAQGGIPTPGERLNPPQPLPEKPRYQHDCQVCVFLGHYDGSDLYFCPQHGIKTVIARFSDLGPDYASGLPAIRNRFLQEAELRATKGGFLP